MKASSAGRAIGRASLAVFVAAFVWACGETTGAFFQPNFEGESGNPPIPWGNLTICKYGTDATFTVVVDGEESEVYVADGFCVTPYTTTERDQPLVDVSVTELAAEGIQLDSIQKDSVFTGEVTFAGTLFGTNTGSGVVSSSKGVTLRFYNSRVDLPGGQGCTPGYWKQPHHFDSWPAPYSPTTMFGDVFDDAFPGMTFLDVLRRGGGGLKALGRHTVAALLNTASDGVNYDIDNINGVIAAFNAAFASGEYEGQKDIFEGFNEQGCPLN